MHCLVGRLLAVCAIVGAGACAGEALGLAGTRPYDGHGQDSAGAIEWKESWEATYKANVERWSSEVRKLASNDEERGLLLRTRVAALLDALLARYPNEGGKRLDALKEIAGNYYACSLAGRGNHALQRLAAEVPGQAELVAAALHRILAETGEELGRIEDWAAWVEYAAPRLVALNRSGSLADGHPALVAAWRALVVLRRAQERFLEAAEALDALEAHTGRDDWWQHEEGELLFAVGREQQALARFQDLWGRSEQNWRARDRIYHISLQPPTSPPSFAGHFALEARWDAIRSSPPGDVADRIGDVLREDAEGKAILPWKDARHASLWVQLDRHLLSLSPEALAPLRQAQEAEAQKLRIPDSRFGVSQSAIGNLQSAMWLAAYRRCPWAAAGQRSLLAYGEEMLRRGHAGLALRSFRDAAAHAADTALRSQAAAGEKLALAQTEKGTFSFSASEKLNVPFSALARRTLRLPPVAPWPPELFAEPFPRELAEAVWPRLVRPQACPEGVLVAGPELLAFYGDDPQRPLWTRTRTGPKGKHGRLDVSDWGVLVIPGLFQPALADGRVYTRWGLDATRRLLTDVAAFDLRTGELLWSTADSPAWDGLWPVGDPTPAEGRLYVLAAREGYAGILPVTTVSLACLDAATGEVLWRRALGSQNVALIPGQQSSHYGLQFDLAHYGNAVTVAEGAVYCQTNLGFVARCDARDGQVEWTAAYEQAPLRWNIARTVRRQGAAPAACGGRVVFLPRDAAGAFALDAATGKLLWDNPYAPTDEALGLADGALVVANGQALAALDMGAPGAGDGSGRARWHRHFPDRIEGAPLLQGNRLLACSGGRLHWLDAATGRLAESSDWGPGGPMPAFALRGASLVGVSPEALGSDAQPVGKPLNPQAKAASGPLRLPLERVWKLERPNPTLLSPPPEAKLDGKLLVLSQGVLECVRATAQGGVEWQRALRPGLQGTAWADGTMLLIYPQSVAALDTASGRLRWETAVPFPIRQWQEAHPYLVLGRFTETERSRTACALDAASGKLLWHREFRELGAGHEDHFHGIGWDGKAIHFLATLERRQGGGHFHVLCDPADGRVAAIRRFLPKGRQWPFLFDVAEGYGFYVDQDKVAWDFALDGSPHVRHGANLADLTAEAERMLRRTRRRRTLQKSEQWTEIYQQEGCPGFRHIHWVLKRGDPAYELRRPRPGVVRGDTLYEAEADGLRIVDLPSRKEVARLPLVLPSHRWGRILDWREEGNAILLVTGIERGPYESAKAPYRVQLDAFDRATGRHLARQLLDDVPYWRFGLYHDWRLDTQHHTQVAWADGLLFLTDAEGLFALASVAQPPSAVPADKPVHVAHLAPRPPAVDGWLDDWLPRQAIPLQGQGGRTGSLYIGHDGQTLYLALAHAAASAAPRRGGADHADGDWLELALTAGDHTLRLTLAEKGTFHFSAREKSNVPFSAPRGAVRHDLLAQQTIYELALPLKPLVRLDSSDRWRRLRLSVAAWQGAQRVLSWGEPWWADAILPEFHESVYLHPLTFEGEEAGFALAHALPELDESWDFFEDSCELRARRRPSRVLADLYRGYLKRHPTGLPAERAILALDRALRGVETGGSPVGVDGTREPRVPTPLGGDPTAEVLRIAQEAGVAEPVRARYARLAKANVSLWLHTDPGRKLPAGLMLQFHDGRERGGWGHRVAWGINPWRGDWGEPGNPAHQHAGPVPHAEGWQELRIPLVWIGLQDSPLCGISFGQYGSGQVVWDRAAVVHEGGEKVFLDDEPPKAKENPGQWAWVAEPRKSGSRAHTEANPVGESETRHRNIEGLQPPITDHLIPPATGAVLSQWVYLDPARPPRAIGLNLQARGDPWRVFWGQAPGLEGRYMGPLPKPGEWHELRVPLAWTPYAAWPLRGILFEDAGGQAIWDRTAIVRDGQEHVLIEDAMPEGSPRNDWKWVESPVKSGKRAHTHPPEQGYEEHGVLYLRQPVTAHLAFDPARAALALQDQIPKLGPTEAAWRFSQVLRDMPPFAERRLADRIRWFFSVLPDHPRNAALLKNLFDYLEDAKDPAPLASVEKVMEESKLPKETRIAFRRQCGTAEPSFVRAWRLLGPFPNPKGAGHAKPYPPETDPVALDKDYEVAPGGTARWRFHSSEADYIDLTKLFKPSEHVVAYAVSWVQSPAAQPVSIEVGSDDGVKLWLNRKPLLDHREVRLSAPRQHTIPAELRAGWNEILLKIEQGIREWGFHLELLDPEARGLLPRLTISSTPPPSRP